MNSKIVTSYSERKNEEKRTHIQPKSFGTYLHGDAQRLKCHGK